MTTNPPYFKRSMRQKLPGKFGKLVNHSGMLLLRRTRMIEEEKVAHYTRDPASLTLISQTYWIVPTVHVF